ncbi:unnamed protein product [Amoebophrya sp. A120]|nr:unnamed protein product [Amoebophrya sp. A120]|eukprot:GSA120T00017203001.1
MGGSAEKHHDNRLKDEYTIIDAIIRRNDVDYAYWIEQLTEALDRNATVAEALVMLKIYPVPRVLTKMVSQEDRFLLSDFASAWEDAVLRLPLKRALGLLDLLSDEIQGATEQLYRMLDEHDTGFSTEDAAHAGARTPTGTRSCTRMTMDGNLQVLGASGAPPPSELQHGNAMDFEDFEEEHELDHELRKQFSADELDEHFLYNSFSEAFLCNIEELRAQLLMRDHERVEHEDVEQEGLAAGEGEVPRENGVKGSELQVQQRSPRSLLIRTFSTTTSPAQSRADEKHTKKGTSNNNKKSTTTSTTTSHHPRQGGLLPPSSKFLRLPAEVPIIPVLNLQDVDKHLQENQRYTFGLDCEWQPGMWTNKGKNNSTTGAGLLVDHHRTNSNLPVSLVQLAVAEKVFLIDFVQLKSKYLMMSSFVSAAPGETAMDYGEQLRNLDRSFVASALGLVHKILEKYAAKVVAFGMEDFARLDLVSNDQTRSRRFLGVEAGRGEEGEDSSASFVLPRCQGHIELHLPKQQHDSNDQDAMKLRKFFHSTELIDLQTVPAPPELPGKTKSKRSSGKAGHCAPKFSDIITSSSSTQERNDFFLSQINETLAVGEENQNNAARPNCTTPTRWTSMSHLCEVIFQGYKLNKQLQCSPWAFLSRPLPVPYQHYAALDAYLALGCYNALNAVPAVQKTLYKYNFATTSQTGQVIKSAGEDESEFSARTSERSYGDEDRPLHFPSKENETLLSSCTAATNCTVNDPATPTPTSTELKKSNSPTSTASSRTIPGRRERNYSLHYSFSELQLKPPSDFGEEGLDEAAQTTTHLLPVRRSSDVGDFGTNTSPKDTTRSGIAIAAERTALGPLAATRMMFDNDAPSTSTSEDEGPREEFFYNNQDQPDLMFCATGTPSCTTSTSTTPHFNKLYEEKNITLQTSKVIQCKTVACERKQGVCGPPHGSDINSMSKYVFCVLPAESKHNLSGAFLQQQGLRVVSPAEVAAKFGFPLFGVGPFAWMFQDQDLKMLEVDKKDHDDAPCPCLPGTSTVEQCGDNSGILAAQRNKEAAPAPVATIYLSTHIPKNATISVGSGWASHDDVTLKCVDHV